jgi:hypothetical protein
MTWKQYCIGEKMNTIIKLLLVWLLTIVVVLTMGCNDDSDSDAADIVGGRCEYNEIHGAAIINAVVEPDVGEDNCKNAVKILFTFTPDDASVPDDYRFGEWPDQNQSFTVGGGKNPPKAWAESAGLVQGSTHKCVRSDIITGTCTPVIFSFPEIDVTGWEKECF